MEGFKLKNEVDKALAALRPRLLSDKTPNDYVMFVNNRMDWDKLEDTFFFEAKDTGYIGLDTEDEDVPEMKKRLAKNALIKAGRRFSNIINDLQSGHADALEHANSKVDTDISLLPKEFKNSFVLSVVRSSLL